MNRNIMRLALQPLALGLTACLLASAALAQDAQRLRYGTTNSIMNLPVWVAQDARLFLKHGLAQVEVVFIQSGTLITMGVVSGELHFSGAGAASVVAARIQGGDVALLACPVDADAVYLIARPGIKSAAELKGKTAAVTRLGSTTHFYLRSALRYAGLDPQKDVKVLQLGLDFSAALGAGQIDAAALPFNLALPYLRKGWPVLLDLSKTDFVYPASCVIGSRAFVKGNSSAVDRFLRAYVESIHLIKKDRAFTEKAFSKWLRQPDPEIARRTVQVYAELFKRVPTVTDGGIKAVLEELAETSPVPKEIMNRPDYFRDPAPLERLVKEGWIEQLYR
ncbi:MAG TPA: ABC transporter substrate-binding protein [Candidatus Binatia bacterium]|nr:ABC transporter substrate-binding protein [Candidatus Binatia bacterium]